MSGARKVGAVLYDPKVSVIWEIIRDFFESQSVPIDVTFYTTYELQVSALLDGSIEIAWNSPLAWLDAQYEPGQIFLNPDCGFGTFSTRPVNTTAVAVEKIRAIADVAGDLRARCAPDAGR